jgi:hypothetical protein
MPPCSKSRGIFEEGKIANNNQYRSDHAERAKLKKQMNEAAGLVSDRFPSVAGMIITMTYYQGSVKSPLMIRTVNIYPTSYANFKMTCMTKGCTDGGFELSAMVEKMVKTQTRMSKGSLLCSGNTDALSNGHARIDYKAVIKYR